MTAASLNTFNFADFHGFAALRRDAAQDTPEARRIVAQQFEAMFLNMMLSQMRDASAIEGGVIDSEQLRPYQSMYDQQLALTLSQHGSIGLADSILRQLDPHPPHPQRSNSGGFWQSQSTVLQRGHEGAPAQAPEPSVSDLQPTVPGSQPTVPGSQPTVPGSQPTVPGSEPTVPRFQPASPAEFVAAVWPYAERAGTALGVAPDVLVAQAALETGWGARQITTADGTASFNLFGVKATGAWQGGYVRVPTLEYVDGVTERRSEPFRRYASLEAGFADYVHIVAGSARYQQALDAGTAEGYLQGLQAGGYATDPDYADKVLAILARGLPGRPHQVHGVAADNPTERPATSAGAGPASLGDAVVTDRQGVVL